MLEDLVSGNEDLGLKVIRETAVRVCVCVDRAAAAAAGTLQSERVKFEMLRD